MELASPLPEEPVTQMDANVPLEPLSLQAEYADLELDLHSYERPLAVSPFGTLEHVPDWDDTHAVTLDARPQSRLGKWIRTDLGLPVKGTREQAVRRIIPHSSITCLSPQEHCETMEQEQQREALRCGVAAGCVVGPTPV